MTELRGTPRPAGQRGAAAVPEFMKIKPDADAAAALAAKAKLTEALKPSADMMDAIMANPALMQARLYLERWLETTGLRIAARRRSALTWLRCAQGFDNPDVMAAVAEVAENPAACVPLAF